VLVKPHYKYHPDTIDFEQALKNGTLTDGKLNERFHTLWGIYYKGLQRLLDKLINFSEYEQRLARSDLAFTPLREDNVYHKSSYCKFLFIRSNIHVERLTLEEIDFLLKNNNDENQLLEFVSSTLERMVFENYGNEPSSRVRINYGPVIPEYFCLGNSLVLEIAYYQSGCKTASEIYQKKDFVKQMKEELIEAGRKIEFPMSVVVNEGSFPLGIQRPRLFR